MVWSSLCPRLHLCLDWIQSVGRQIWPNLQSHHFRKDLGLDIRSTNCPHASRRTSTDLLGSQFALECSQHKRWRRILAVSEARWYVRLTELEISTYFRTDVWRRQRKFETTALLEARNAHYYGVIGLETKRLLVQVLRNNADYGVLFDDFASSVGCTLAYGTPHGASEFIKNANALMQSISPAGAVANICKPLSYIPAWLYGPKWAENKRHAHEWNVFSQLLTVAKSQKNLQPSQARTYFMRKDATGFSEKEATYVLGAFPTVAVITITSPLRSFIMAMALHPEWQVAVREELDRVCGGKMPELTDSLNLPVLRAVIKETLRWKPVTPLGM